MTKRNVENRLDDLEDEHGGDDVEDMDAGELYMRMLKAHHQGRPGDAERAWDAYQDRLAAAADETEGD